MRHLTTVFLSCAISAAALADEVEFEAVLHDGDPVAQASALMSLDDFLSSGQEISEAGLRIFDVETVQVDGQRRYIGLWRPGGGFSRFIGPVGPIEFGDLTREMRDEGRRLEDFEIFRTASGGRRYLGIWRNGAGEEVLTGPMVPSAFGARGLQMAQRGMSLVDVEVEVFNGNVLYHGLFRTEVGPTTNRISEQPLSLEDFRLERDSMAEQGRFLADMETFEIDGEVMYVGLWRAGNQGQTSISALRAPDEFRTFLQEQADAGRSPTDLEPRRIVPDDMPPPPPPPNVTTADLPSPPDWVSLPGPFGNRRVVVEFNSNALPPPGYRIEVHTDLLPILPRNADGEIVFPDNICGLRVFDPSSTEWQTPTGDVIEDGLHLRQPNYNDIPLSTEAMSGIDFTGPIGACETANDPWQFNWPLTSNSTGGPPNRILTFENPTRVEFLNHNVVTENPFDASLEPKDFFKPAIMDLLEQIAKGFIEEEENNGYCSGVVEYMVAVCGEDPDNCPFAVDFDGEVIDYNASC